MNPRFAPVPTTIRGTLYPSLSAAANALKVSPQAVWSALEIGREDYIGLGRAYKQKPCRVNGVIYPSQRAAALATGINENTIAYRLGKKKPGYEKIGE